MPHKELVDIGTDSLNCAELQPGLRQVTAPLSDPDAKPGKDHLKAVDAGAVLLLSLHCQYFTGSSLIQRANVAADCTEFAIAAQYVALTAGGATGGGGGGGGCLTSERICN